MNTLLIFLSSLLLSPADSVILTLSIDNVREQEGQMIIKFYEKDNDFLSHDTYKLIKIKAKVPSTKTKVVLPKGRYAIAVYHDIDMSGKMNKNFIGMPNEPVGISNDAIKGLSKPTFEDASFELDNKLSISINLKHFF